MTTDVQITTLKNGVRVATSTLPHVQSVSMGIWVGAGGRHESARLSGVSHFLEHLLFKGTPTRSPLDISQEIEGRGGSLNAFTQEESTCYYCRVPYDRMRDGLAVLGDMFLNSSLDPVEIDKERGVIIEELMMYRDQPQHESCEALNELFWHNHPAGRSVGGTPESVARLTREDIVGYRERHYIPARTVFAFAGLVEHDRCVDLVEALMGATVRRRAPRFRTVDERVAQHAHRIVARDIEQVHLAMGYRLFGRQDLRRYTLRILNAALGENMSSRLFQIVREKHGLAYSVNSSMHLMRETGALCITAGLDRQNLVKAVNLILREVERMQRRPVGAGELRRAKEYCIGQLRLGMESTGTHMMWLGEHLLTYGRVISSEESIDRLGAVTADDVLQLAEEIFSRDALSLSVVAPELTAKTEAGVVSVFGKR